MFMAGLAVFIKNQVMFLLAFKRKNKSVKQNCFSGNLSWLRECLDNRVGVNGLDKAGNTALYWACHGGHKGMGEFIGDNCPLIFLICLLDLSLIHI